MSKKVLAYAVILLFIGLAINPSFSADVFEKKELSDIVVNIYEIDKVHSNNILLTKEQADRLDAIFDKLKYVKDHTNSYEEVNSVYELAIKEIIKLGLIDDEDVDEVKQLILRTNYDTKMLKYLERSNYYITSDSYTNCLCKISGEIDDVYFYDNEGRMLNSKLAFFSSIFGIFDNIDERLLSILLGIFLVLERILSYFPRLYDIIDKLLDIIFTFLRSLVLDLAYLFFYCFTYFDKSNKKKRNSELDTITFGLDGSASNGWVSSIGLNGNVEWNGTLYGNLKPKFIMKIASTYPGVLGFTGINIYNHTTRKNYILGSALYVDIAYDKPWWIHHIYNDSKI